MNAAAAAAMAEIQAFLQRPGVLEWAALVLAGTTLLFLVLWLRSRGGKGGPNQRDDAAGKAARQELRVLRGDLIQAKKDHEAEVGKLRRQLANLEAVAGGQVPPELEELRRRVPELEAQLAAERAKAGTRHGTTAERAAAKGSLERTAIAPNIPALYERLAAVEQELAEAKRKLEEAEGRHEGELAALRERLSAEKAAALTALAARLGGKAPPDGAVPAGPSEVAGGMPETARYAFLEVVEGGPVGTRHHLPYDQATIGRSPTSTIAIEEPQASRDHAEIRFDGKDFVLRDLKSRNGTFINEKPVETATLQFGDMIGIGALRMRFGCAASAVAEQDPGRAADSYRAMIAAAPTFRAALQNLAALLDHDDGRRDEAAALRERLSALDRVA
jgi:tetratricopeptide (TPR) repeat protein